MKEITRKQFMGGMAATVALGWRGTFAAPMRRQRNYDDMPLWDPYVEDIADADTYLRRKFRQDVTDKTTGVGVAALKKILAEIVAADEGGSSVPAAGGGRQYPSGRRDGVAYRERQHRLPDKGR